jgi:hypothetical protein
VTKIERSFFIMLRQAQHDNRDLKKDKKLENANWENAPVN